MLEVEVESARLRLWFDTAFEEGTEGVFHVAPQVSSVFHTALGWRMGE